MMARLGLQAVPYFAERRNMLFVTKCKYGRSVFTDTFISPCEIVEQCHALIFKNKQIREPDDYSFEWGDGTCAILTGFGSFYNHSYKPNATYIFDCKNTIVLFVSLCNIKAGEQLFINYNGDIYCKDKLWLNTTPHH